MKSGRYTLNTVTGDSAEPQTQRLCQDEGEARVCRGSRCLVLMTVCLGIICVLLLVFIIAQHISNTAEIESLFKSNKTINRLQDENINQMTEKDQLKNSFSSSSQKNLEPQTSAKDLTAEKSQIQGSFDSLSQKKLELETRVKDITAEKSQLQGRVKSLNQKNLDFETKVKDLTDEKSQLQRIVDELERNVTSLSEELKKEKSKREFVKRKFLLGNLPGPVCLFKSDELMSWSESRQYCRDHGGDLVIINTEEKQRLISSFIKERVWIGLSKTAIKGNMKWVDNSTLNKGYWYEQPNNAGGNEDCVELLPLDTTENWNDLPCSERRKGICEK